MLWWLLCLDFFEQRTIFALLSPIFHPRCSIHSIPTYLHAFICIGHSLRHEARVESGGDVAEKYRRAVERGAGGHEADHDGMPSYIKVGSPEEIKWRREHSNGRRSKLNSFGTGSTSIAHRAAQGGDVETLKDALKSDKSLALAKDSNGWEPIHEASRGGHRDAVELLLKNGADVNAR